mgnify:CR=1 FL=1
MTLAEYYDWLVVDIGMGVLGYTQQQAEWMEVAALLGAYRARIKLLGDIFGTTKKKGKGKDGKPTPIKGGGGKDMKFTAKVFDLLFPGTVPKPRYKQPIKDTK